MPARILLEVTKGPIEGARFEFASRGVLLFGRGGDCQAQIKNDRYVSRHHFLLEADPPEVHLRDLGSQNGTHVNETKLGGRLPGAPPANKPAVRAPQIELNDGDRIKVGTTVIDVKIVVPVVCRECGNEAKDGRAASDRVKEYVCDSCRRESGKAGAAFRPATRVCCEKCRRDVSNEVHEGRGGSFLCKACRGESQSEVGRIQQLLRAARRWARGPVQRSLDDYEISGELGKGGMGIVYDAIRNSDGQRVALKVMLANVAVSESARRQFMREIEVTGQLRHPNIVELLDSGCCGSQFFFVMEHCNAGSLDDLIEARGGTLAFQEAVPMMLQCLDGLECAHRAKVVHRDIKPGNILLDQANGVQIAKIADLGLAKNFEQAGLSGMTLTMGGPGGTPAFMPREQITQFKYVRPASDIWSLAATFYYALTGALPLSFPPGRDPIEVLLRDEPVPIRKRHSQLPKVLARVIDRALNVNVHERYSSVDEMRSALREGRP